MRGVRGVVVGVRGIEWCEKLPSHLLSQLSLIHPPIMK